MKNTKRPASFIPCGARQGRAGISISARCYVTIVSSSNDDGNVTENGRTTIGLDRQNNNFARASRFFVHYLPSLHDYDVKTPNFTYGGGREHKTTTLFLFSWTSLHSFRIRQLQKKLPAFDELNEME